MYELMIWYIENKNEGLQGRTYLFTSLSDAYMARRDHAKWFLSMGVCLVDAKIEQVKANDFQPA